MQPTEQALRNVSDTLAIAMQHDGSRAALIVADEQCPLARLLLGTYRQCLPAADVVLFSDTSPELAKNGFSKLVSGDLVVLIQSSVFRIADFRIRVELYKLGIKVIEHSNLSRMLPDEIEHYVAALAYDAAYYRGIGHPLKARMDLAKTARVESGGEVLYFDAPLESAKVNIGDFSSLRNFGSQFPIGEVFTESRDLQAVHGRACLYAFTDTTMRLNVPDAPITIVVESGRIAFALHSTTAFEEVLAAIRRDEGEVWIRELGFGMNRGLSRDRRVSDVGAFERVCGVHLSLGARHGVYKKPHLHHRQVRYHVDSFVATDGVWLDDQRVFGDGQWRRLDA